MAPIGLDHFVHFAFPALAIEKSRIDPHLVQRVTGAAIAFDDVPPGPVLERHDLFGRSRKA